MREKVEAALEQIKPALLADGGDVQLVDVSQRCGHGEAHWRLLRLPNGNHNFTTGD